jgi:hypothetical protein
MPDRPSIDAAPRARVRRRLLRALLVAGGLVAGLVGAELGYRAWLALAGRPWDARAADERMLAIATTMNEALPRLEGGTGEEAFDGRAVHPYIGVDSRKSLAIWEEQARLFRGTEYDDAFVVVVLGGSVAAHVATYAHEELQAALAADPRLAGRRPVVVSAARGSLKQPQQATLLAYLLALGWDPDAVVNVDGFNELALAWDNIEHDVHPVHPAYSGWAVLAARRSDLSRELVLVASIADHARRARELADAARSGGRTRSALAGRTALRRLDALERTWAEEQERYRALVLGGEQRNPAKGPRFEEQGDAAAERVLACWSSSSRSLAGLCRERGIPYLHVLQPTLHDAGSKPLTDEERATSGSPELWQRAVREGYPRLRAEGTRLAASGVAFADLSMLFREFTATTYVDGCHFRGSGLELFARTIAAELLARLPPALARRRGPGTR